MSHPTVRQFIATTLLAAAAIPAAAQASTLERGDSGSQVRVVQRTLTKLGFRTTVDGVFGRRTSRNVARYERRERLRVDGRVSRGQLRGMLRRAGDPAPVEQKPVARQRAAVPAGGRAFPIEGTWKWGGDDAGFGDRGGSHKGEDVFAGCGTPLVAAEGGKVVFSGTHEAAGNYLVVRGAETGEDHVYMHLQSAPSVEKGGAVQAGQAVGAVGRSGNASACHLHFEIWTKPGWYEGGEARDPRPDLESWAEASGTQAAS